MLDLKNEQGEEKERLRHRRRGGVDTVRRKREEEEGEVAEERIFRAFVEKDQNLNIGEWSLERGRGRVNSRN